MNNPSLLTSDLPEPTELEIKQTKKLIKDKYDIVMPDTETARLVTLIKELEWWQKASAKSDSPRQFKEEQLDDLRDLLEQSGSQNLSPSDVHNHATSLLALVPVKEKQRVADEIRGLLVEHRPVPYEPTVAEKTAELLKIHYDVTLTAEQLEQAIPFLTRTLWYEVGLDSSLEECLDDLIHYAHKRKRGELVKDAILHDAIRRAFDLTISKLTNKAFDPLST